jgi:hypothetical protein
VQHDATEEDVMVRIVDPTGTEPAMDTLMGAPRPESLAGRKVIVLDNGKPNADYVVRRLAEHLSRRHGSDFPVAAGKALASRPAPDDVLAGFRGFDAAIVGVGD